MTTTLHEASFPDLEPLQLLRPDGTRVDDERHPVELEPAQHLELYEAMVVTRAIDVEMVNLQRQGQLALYPSCRGQEAAQVGTTYALEPRDFIFPQYRELGSWVVRHIDPVGVGLMWRGVWHGGDGLLDGCSAPMSIPIATQALHALGYAIGAALDGEPTVAVGCIGDGATSEGDFHEALNFAAVFDAPCIFLVQNNQYAISIPVHEQTRSASLAHKAVAYGIPGVRCDGNDVLACYAVMKEAAARARSGRGPTLIEAVTYRMEAHTTSDDATRYRSEEELEAWRRLDPIARYRTFLTAGGVLDESARTAAEDKAADATRRLRDEVYDAPDGDPFEVFDHVFAETTPALAAQAAELRAELEGDDAPGLDEALGTA